MRFLRSVLWLALPVGIVVGGINAASAQSEDVRQACTPDAERLCSQFIPDADKVKTCMLHNIPRLSAACRNAMRASRPAYHHPVYRHERRVYHHYYHHHYYHHRYYKH